MELSQNYSFLLVGDEVWCSQPVTERLHRFQEVVSHHELTVRSSLSSIITDSDLAALGGDGSTVFIAGAIRAVALRKLCRHLKAQSFNVIVLVDALEIIGNREAILSYVEKEGVHLSLTEGAIFLLKQSNRFIYAFPKADVGTSVVVLLESSGSIVLIRRKLPPFKGQYALPGGFLRPLLEDLPTCALRELKEETGIALPKDSLNLVRVKSNPDRDDRGHVIDHGFVGVVPKELESSIRQSLNAADDADAVAILPIETALTLELAADHKSLIEDAVALSGWKDSHRSLRGWVDKFVSPLRAATALLTAVT